MRLFTHHFFTVLFFFPFFSNAQDTTKHNLPMGSAQTLKGKNLIINVFISLPKHAWKNEDKQLELYNEQQGFQWLLRQQRFWNVSGNSFDTVSFGLDKDVTVNKIYAFDDKKRNLPEAQLTPIVFEAMGITDIQHFYDSIKTAKNADNVAVIVFFNKRGRSYAQPSYSNIWNDRFLESAIVYHYDLNDKESTAGTIIHEMLHLYGAWDMYHSETRNSTVDASIGSVFRNSIMLESHQDITGKTIDQLTAWCIGWFRVYRNWYEMFRDTKPTEIWTKIPI